MNNQFLQHLKSITPQGRAENTKIFIPADQIKEMEKEKEPEVEELNEATRSKYIKAYRKHKVGTDTSKLDIEDAKRNAAVLRRGGADDETIRQGSFPTKIPMSLYNKVNMAKYRFGSKAQRSREDGKKSPREQLNELDKKTLASYIRKAAQNMENMGYASGWKNAKNRFTGAKAEYDWQANLQKTRQRKTKNRRRGIELATSQLSEAITEKLRINNIGTH